MQKEGIKVLTISSNDVQVSTRLSEKMKELAQSYGFEFPYLLMSQEVISFRAACTDFSF